METSKPQIGIWKLIAPDGREFTAESPLYCCREEQKTRVPEAVAMKRLLSSLSKCVLCEEELGRFTLGRGTPAEIGPLCLTCKNTLLSERADDDAKQHEQPKE